MQQLSWDDLRFFIALARTGSPSAASRSLAVDHTTVRRRVTLLEVALRARLFEPRDRGFILTDEGEKLLVIAKNVESLMLEAQESIAGNDTAMEGLVRIGSPDGFGTFFLTPHLARFQREHPGLTIELTAISREYDLSKREADIAVTMELPPDGRQSARRLTDLFAYLYATQEYLDSHDPIEKIEDLATHMFIGYPNGMTFAENLNYLAPEQDERSYCFLSPNLVVQHQATLAGLGICKLPEYMVQGDRRLKPVLPDQVKIKREFWLVIHSDLRNVARFRAVADFIVAIVKEHRPLFVQDTVPER
jgi:DNA-binding transcriptional LysR family regulator